MLVRARLPERPKGADCKSVGIAYRSSNLLPGTTNHTGNGVVFVLCAMGSGPWLVGDEWGCARALRRTLPHLLVRVRAKASWLGFASGGLFPVLVRRACPNEDTFAVIGANFGKGVLLRVTHAFATPATKTPTTKTPRSKTPAANAHNETYIFALLPADLCSLCVSG